MITASVAVYDNGLIDAYADLADESADFVNVVTNQVVNDTADEVLADFRREPGGVRRPIIWTSAKQRRYVMWAIRQGLITAPYVRDHSLSRGWEMKVVYTPGELSRIELDNPSDIATFVYGLRQQQWHRATGWLYAPDEMAIWSDILVDRMETALIKAFYAVEPGEKHV